ncbi:MAG: phosphoenolpyruvate-utilizing N-terminal domain-containing protein, partial [Spirochaetota bacterium]
MSETRRETRDDSAPGGANDGTALPLELPAPSEVSLERPRELNTYLALVAQAIREHVSAAVVGVYLLDPSTSRLSLRAWTDRTGAASPDVDRAPSDLMRRGIDGDDLNAGTLRDYMHAAPRGERIATPVHDGERWIGAIVALADEPFADEAPVVLHDAAAQLAAVLAEAAMPIGNARIEESEESLELPSDAIFGHGAGEGVAVGPALRFRSGIERGGATEKVEEDRSQALERLDAALEKTRSDIEAMLSDSSNELYDVVSLIFSTHLLMLTDDAFSGPIRSLVEAGQTPEDAVQSVVASFVRTFRGLRETRLAEKAQDVRDIGQRLLDNLAPDAPHHEELAGHIAVVHDVLP